LSNGNKEDGKPLAFQEEAQAPKFHFEIVDGYTLEDPYGMHLSTEQQAKKVAEEIARQIAADAEDQELKNVVVKTEDGEVLHKTPIKPA
jgi:uncharacterized protein DUF6894